MRPRHPWAAWRAALLFFGLLGGCAATTSLKIRGPVEDLRAAQYEAAVEFRR